MATKTCSKCGVDRDIEMFRFKDRKRQLRQSSCKQCNSLLAKERGYNVRSQKSERMARVEMGLCRVCTRKAIDGKRVCDKHYVVDVCSKSLGTASSSIAETLLERFNQNPFCPYTGERLRLGYNAHLDHVVSVKARPDLKNDISNVEWISEKANLSKSCFSKQEFINFCKKIASRFES